MFFFCERLCINMKHILSSDDVTVAAKFPAGANYARPQQRPVDQTRTQANQPSRYDVMTSAVAVTSFPLPQPVLCSMLLLFHAAV